jgi:hypothetical protein
MRQHAPNRSTKTIDKQKTFNKVDSASRIKPHLHDSGGGICLIERIQIFDSPLGRSLQVGLKDRPFRLQDLFVPYHSRGVGKKKPIGRRHNDREGRGGSEVSRS